MITTSKTFLAFNMSESVWNWDEQKREANITYTIVHDENIHNALKQIKDKYGDMRWLLVESTDFSESNHIVLTK